MPIYKVAEIPILIEFVGLPVDRLYMYAAVLTQSIIKEVIIWTHDSLYMMTNTDTELIGIWNQAKSQVL